MGNHIGAMPRTPFPASRDFAPVGSMSLDSRVVGLPYESSSFATSREKRDMRKKTASHILHVPFRRFPPLVAGATTFPPQAGALWVLSNGAMSLQESIEQFILPPLADRGALGAASQSAEWLFCPMTLKVNPVTPLASPLGEEGHEVAKGCTRVRMIMILLFYVLSPFDRGPPIGGKDRDGASYRCSAPYTLSRFAGLPLKGKRENRWHWILCHI